MKNIKFKLILFVAFLISFIMIPISVKAANENVQIVQKNTNDYIIYVKDNLDNDFEFAFSNNLSESLENLEDNLRDSEDDSNGNQIAYINSSITDHKYLWIKKDGNYVIEGEKIDLSKSITETQLKLASSFTKIIPADLTQKDTQEEIVGDKKIITTRGKVVLTNKESTYKYLIVKANYSEKTSKAFNLATRISKFNQSTDIFTKISVYKEFIDVILEIKPETNSNYWLKLSGNEIIQPEDSVDGDEYILYIAELNGERVVNEDIQFLTATRNESEEKIIEKIQTKLPVTYDNNILLIVFAVIILLIVSVIIRIKFLTKKEK